MNKSEFIDRVAEKAEMTRAAAARAIDAIFDTASGAISEAVHAAGTFSIPGFGKFTKKTRAARTGRNPRTGAAIKIPERATVSFAAGKGLKSGTSTSRRKRTATGGTGTTARKRGSTATKKTASTATKGARKSSAGGRKTAASGGTARKTTGAAKKSTGTARKGTKSGGR